VDAAGNQTISAFKVTLDSKAPVVTNIPAEVLTNKANQIKVPLTIDGLATAEIYTIDLGANATDGIYEDVTLEIRDAAGNVTRVVLKVVLDTTPPAIVLPAGLNGKLTNNRTLIVDYTVDGGAKTATYTLNEGQNEFTITEVDLAGNSALKTFQVNLDTVPPVVTGVPTEPVMIYANAKLRLPLTIDGQATDELYDLNLGSNPADGHHEVTLDILDAAGNKTQVKFTVLLITHVSQLPNLPEPRVTGFNDQGRTAFPGYVTLVPGDSNRFSYRYDMGSGAGAKIVVTLEPKTRDELMNVGPFAALELKRVNKLAGSDGVKKMRIRFVDKDGNVIEQQVEVSNESKLIGFDLKKPGFDFTAVERIELVHSFSDLSNTKDLREADRRGEIFVNFSAIYHKAKIQGTTHDASTLTVFPDDSKLDSSGLNTGNGTIPGYITLLNKTEEGRYPFRYHVVGSATAAVRVHVFRPDNQLFVLDSKITIAMKNGDNQSETVVRFRDVNGRTAEFVLALKNGIQNFTLDLSDPIYAQAGFDRSKVAMMEFEVNRTVATTQPSQMEFQIGGLDDRIKVVVGKSVPSETARLVSRLRGQGTAGIFGRFVSDRTVAPIVTAAGATTGLGFNFDVDNSKKDDAGLKILAAPGKLLSLDTDSRLIFQAQALNTAGQAMSVPLHMQLTLTDADGVMVTMLLKVTQNIGQFEVDLKDVNPNFHAKKIVSMEFKVNQDIESNSEVRHAKFNVWLKELAKQFDVPVDQQ
jgi:hypothetical protein